MQDFGLEISAGLTTNDFHSPRLNFTVLSRPSSRRWRQPGNVSGFSLSFPRLGPETISNMGDIMGTLSVSAVTLHNQQLQQELQQNWKQESVANNRQVC